MQTTQAILASDPYIGQLMVAQAQNEPEVQEDFDEEVEEKMEEVGLLIAMAAIILTWNLYHLLDDNLKLGWTIARRNSRRLCLFPRNLTGPSPYSNPLHRG
uniref:Uncharacterized protein n=1 Tax=Cannabis sativa TaxID=3483 RepID=A0A803Q9I1_CANSA